MQRLWIFALVFFVALAGCGGLKAKLVGSWKIDPTSLKSPMLDQLKSNPQVAAAIKKGVESTRLELKEDGTAKLTSTEGGSALDGKWSLNGDKLSVIFPAAGSNAPTVSVNSDGTKIHLVQGGQISAEMDMVKA